MLRHSRLDKPRVTQESESESSSMKGDDEDSDFDLNPTTAAFS